MGTMAFTKLGVAPPDGTTNVGKFRLLAGDSEWEPLDPPQEGMGLYQLWTDAEIEAFLEVSGGSVPRAIAMAYSQIGAMWASTGATIKTDDLSYSVKDSVGNWLALANYWRGIADDEANGAVNDYFDLVPTATDGVDCRKPEASPWPLDHFGFGPGMFRW